MTAASASRSGRLRSCGRRGAGRNCLECRYRIGKLLVCHGEIRGLGSEDRLGPGKFRLSFLKGVLSGFDVSPSEIFSSSALCRTSTALAWSSRAVSKAASASSSSSTACS